MAGSMYGREVADGIDAQDHSCPRSTSGSVGQGGGQALAHTTDLREKLAAVAALEAMRLPVGAVEDMIAESLPEASRLTERSGSDAQASQGSPAAQKR